MAKTPSMQHRCRLFFESAYEQKKGVKYYYAAKDASALKQILGKIKFLMPHEEQNDEQKIEGNFQAFINTILFTNGLRNTWIIDNLSLSLINSKFNEIYSQLTHGTTKQPSAADVQRAFGSRNIDAGILEFLT